MARLIDADALPVHKAYCVDEAGWGANFYVVDKSDVDNAPTVDAVEVVRCKDCKRFVDNKQARVTYCRRSLKDMTVKPNDFCSYGERRNDGKL